MENTEVEFGESLVHVVEQLRGALTELLAGVDADPSIPYAVSRYLGVNKNLAWKVCRIVTSNDPWLSVEALPGAQGVEIFLSAAGEKGAAERSITAVRSALREFQDLIDAHAGDRRTLELMLASHPTSPPEPMEESRRLAFEGNSAIWGIQARLRFSAFFAAPAGDDREWADVVNLGGLIDVRRMRPDVTAPVFVVHAYNDDGTSRTASYEPLDPGAAADDPSFLMPRFCSPNAPVLVPVRVDRAVRYELPKGPVGRRSLASWVFGAKVPRIGRVQRDERNRFGQHSTRLFVPVENLLIDLFVHRDLPFHDFERALVSQLAGEQFAGVLREGECLPLHEPLLEVGGRPPVVATPLMPGYSELVRWTIERVGWNSDRFTCRRFVMRFPPIPTVVVLRYALGAAEE